MLPGGSVVDLRRTTGPVAISVYCSGDIAVSLTRSKLTSVTAMNFLQIHINASPLRACGKNFLSATFLRPTPVRRQLCAWSKMAKKWSVVLVKIVSLGLDAPQKSIHDGHNRVNKTINSNMVKYAGTE